MTLDKKSARQAREKAFKARYGAKRKAIEIFEKKVINSAPYLNLTRVDEEINAFMKEREQAGKALRDQIDALQQKMHNLGLEMTNRLEPLREFRQTHHKEIAALRKQYAAEVDVQFPDLMNVHSVSTWREYQVPQDAKEPL